ncbi:hypothetical protein [Maricaulis maris]|uniref:hypothetical protein n=1 Tax=Maricaulis maris TaxID=74318 RepID=UPI003B8B4707
MAMSKIGTALAGLVMFALAGCNTLTAPPPPAALNGASFCLSVAGPIDSANPTAGYAFEIRARDYSDQGTALADDLDCQLNEIMARQALYNQRYNAIAGEHRAINLGSIGSALLGAGFATFDAHQDNVSAAALSLGGLTVLRNGLNQAELMDAYADGASAMGCYAEPGQRIYSGLRLGHDSELQAYHEELAGLVAQGHIRLENQPESNGDSDQDKAALRQAISLAGTVVTEIRTSRAALNQFSTEIGRSWRSADRATLARLRNQAPNIASLVEAAQALTNPGNGNQTSGNAAQPPERSSAAAANRTAAVITRNLTAQIGEARAFMERNRYPAALAALAQCQALAAG